MFAHFSIRAKLQIGATMLCLIVVVLSCSAISAVSSYRRLVRSVSNRAAELPLADKLIQSVNHLQMTFGSIRSSYQISDRTQYDPLALRQDFKLACDLVDMALHSYRERLEQVEPNGSEIVNNDSEWETVHKIRRTLKRINELKDQEDWVLEAVKADLQTELNDLHALTNELPRHLQGRMQHLKVNVQGQYRTLIVLTWTTSVLAVGLLLILVKFFYDWVFRPLRELVHGSRRVAAGDFNHTIRLPTQDEMAELATAMNDMRIRFRQIRDDLDRQVKQRTKEVVRSEQMASVGFLAAGVAHEINNPLASIAWCAESLESRLHDIIYVDEVDGEEDNHEIKVLRTYLRRIQDEAFRCKGITEALLDFSRMGDVQKHDTDLREVIEDVIDMVKHLGRYRNKSIDFTCGQSVVARVNGQEVKQVILNLITNALDSLGADGRVEVHLEKKGELAELIVRDNGCGMTDEVLEHLFEPFFTRRRDGQGTGLGLSISYRIIVDHGGAIEPSSAGPGAGSQFRVTLPLVQNNEEKQQIHQRAA